MKTKVTFLDVCLPEDFQGYEGLTVAIPVDGRTTCLELRDALKAELSVLESCMTNADRHAQVMMAVDTLWEEGVAYHPFIQLDKALLPPVGYEIAEGRPDGNASSLYWFVSPDGSCGTPFNTAVEAIYEAWAKARSFAKRPQYYAYYGVYLAAHAEKKARVSVTTSRQGKVIPFVCTSSANR